MIVVTGASGMVGSRLFDTLRSQDRKVRRLVRRAAKNADEVSFEETRADLRPSEWDGCEALVHLAGENIASGRWTAAKKEAIRHSRVDFTRRLARGLARLRSPPGVLISASAIGYYGDRGNEVLSEDAEPGQGFLPEVCVEWEAAAEAAREAGIRVVHLRYGVLLSPRGGALARMLTPFKLGLGGVLGSGEQYMSWLSLDDAVGIILFALEEKGLQGPLNAVSPHAATNREFTRALGRALHRPTLFPMPAFAARLAFGEMAQDLLLASTRVEPVRLLQAGYPYRHRTLDETLAALLG